MRSLATLRCATLSSRTAVIVCLRAYLFVVSMTVLLIRLQTVQCRASHNDIDVAVTVSDYPSVLRACPCLHSCLQLSRPRPYA